FTTCNFSPSIKKYQSNWSEFTYSNFHNEKDKKLAILRTFDPTKIQLCVSLPAKTHLIFTRS
ncbi:MAG TPA: hypothetical protein PKC06_03665, partial [Saprospiraceae bacterium]|nr:hypothetical protein [Saprospiraceae bacterium]